MLLTCPTCQGTKFRVDASGPLCVACFKNVRENVRDHGAVGDGVTDDAPAFQKAVGTVDVPPGPTVASR